MVGRLKHARLNLELRVQLLTGLLMLFQTLSRLEGKAAAKIDYSKKPPVGLDVALSSLVDRRSMRYVK